jgi:hypothetical protein
MKRPCDRLALALLFVSLWVPPPIAKAEAQPSSSRNWGPEQATGAPDTPQPGDVPTAWTSLTPDGQKEWLLLEYAEAVKPRAVRVVETYNPGALERVTVFDPQDREVEVWKGEDPTPPISAMGTSNIPVNVDFPVKRVKIYLDSPAVEGWNEIDAVGLVDAEGKLHWAESATASSTYADHPQMPQSVESSQEQPKIPEGAVCISHVDNTAEGKQSYGGTGFGIRFTRPEEATHVVAVQIFASRYGDPQPPDEDFHIYLMDNEWKVIKDLPYAYARVGWGRPRWYTFLVPPTEVPQEFAIGLWFNAHQTKGIYVGKDTDVSQSHSFTGRPESGYEPVDKRHDWMVRVYLMPAKQGGQ